jgi:hypothetical protein
MRDPPHTRAVAWRALTAGSGWAGLCWLSVTEDLRRLRLVFMAVTAATLVVGLLIGLASLQSSADTGVLGLLGSGGFLAFGLYFLVALIRNRR